MSIRSMRENPELFRIVLKDIAQKIANRLSISDEDDDNWRYIKIFLQDQFKESINKLIDTMWEREEISSKIKHLQELEKLFPADYVAWRPTVGVVPITTLKGIYLNNLKNQLIEKIKNNLQKADSFQVALSKKLEAVDKSEKKIAANEKNYATDLLLFSKNN